MFETIYPHFWMVLPKDIRDHLVNVFSIEKTGISEIRDQDVISDGHSAEDLRAITLEKMTEYIGSEETFPRAWELTCMKAKYELNPPISMTPTPTATEIIEPNKTPHAKSKKSE